MSVVTEKIGRIDKIGMYLLSLWLLFILIIASKLNLKNVDICFSCDFATSNIFWTIAKDNYISGICLVLFLISLFFYYRFKFIIDGAKDGPKIVETIEDKGTEHLVFLATYIIPLAGFGLDEVRKEIILAIILVFLGVIYIKTNLFYANPTLSLLGFKIFSARVDNKEVILISTQEIEAGDSINYMPLDKKVFFARQAFKL
ncbi:anti-phage protein KwaA [Polaromonas sp. CG_9.11]|uniref:anti-phage protein KwaA n=1 Tax=Polaromonas sp. CG_9.11 TaxID=2787730 RepID=UPI0018CB35A1|nr:anti-phage protein KwaA [Polaromonas sp. CG_9.11]MBG6077972.1 hypothetical protein [Polaromonas sp. CG_9.11]